MIAKFKNHLASELPFLKGKKLLITVSGGIDSIVLTHLLSHLNYDISIAHCNFQLRGIESSLDEESVKALAKNLKISIHTTSFETESYAKKHQLSIQLAARELRYKWFEKIRVENSYDYILTGHHKNDVLETFLINLTRGTGLDGLTGIPQVNGVIVRPMLTLTRDEIKTYAVKNNIHWREDKSNASTKYVRNKIRHQVIPVLQELNPSLLDTFESTLTHLKASQQIIKGSIESLQKEIITTQDDILEIDIEKLQQLPSPKNYIFELLRTYNFTEWDDILNLLSAQSGKQVFSKTHRLIKDREKLLLTKIEAKSPPSTYTFPELQPEFSTHDISVSLSHDENLAANENQNNSVFVDLSLITFPLTLKKWQHGDYFYPIGFAGKKKLSDYFKDEKMSLIDKERTWILANAQNEIIWVVGKRLDNRFRVTPKTTKILCLTLNN